MKRLFVFLSALCASVAIHGQNTANGPVTKKIGTNLINEDLTIGPGRTLTVTGTLNASGGTVSTPAATTSTAGSVTLADTITTLAGTSTTTAVTPSSWSFATAAQKNALAARGGVAFDGTSSTRLFVPLTSQSISTDPFSLVLILKWTTTNVYQGLAILSSSATTGSIANALNVDFDNSNTLRVYLYGATTSDFRQAAIANFATQYLGKVTTLIITVSTGSLHIYVNGVATSFVETSGGSAPAWGSSVTSTYLGLGFNAASNILRGTIYSASLYNMALSSSDEEEIYELAGAVPDRLKWGSEVNRSTLAGTTEIGSVGSFASTSTSFSGTPAGTGAQIGFRGGTTIANNKVYRMRFTATTIPDAGLPRYGLGNGSAAYNATLGSNEQVITTTNQAGASGMFFYSGSGTYTVPWNVSAISVVQLGAVIYFPLDDGIGYQLHDTSTNALHALRTTTGTSNVIQRDRGNIRGTTSTSGNQQLLGAAAIPIGYQVTRIRAMAETGTPSVTLGNASGGSQYATSATLATGVWKVIPIVAGNEVTSTTNLWVNSTTTDVVDWDIEYERLSK